MRSFRGTVIKTPDVSPGLLFVGGQQKSFLLTGVWNSRRAPEPNMIVDVVLDDTGSVVNIAPVEPWQLARERFLGFAAATRRAARRAIKAVFGRRRTEH